MVEVPMIVTRQEAARVLADQKAGRTGTVEPDVASTTKIWEFGTRALPVMVQAEAALWEAIVGGRPLSPCMAALAVALHQAWPGQFNFADCACRGEYLELTKCHEKPGPPCARRLWLEEMRERMIMPPAIETAQTITPGRG
jgi:hypothetical protein